MSKRNFSVRFCKLYPAVLVLSLGAVLPTFAVAEDPVEVVVDMNAAAPGIQRVLRVPEGAHITTRAEVWIRDPLGTRSFYSIGYVGAIDRGIGLGNMPFGNPLGTVEAMEPAGVHPVNPGNTGELLPENVIQRMFVGPEVQYLEFGAAQPTVIPAQPQFAAFSVDIHLTDTAPQDRFQFFLVDAVTVWQHGQAGAFSTQQPLNSLDTGGDAVPDATQTIYGVDPDTPQPVPPAAFPVDYVDGPPNSGPAWLEVVPLGDANCDGAFNFLDINPFVLALMDPAAYASAYPYCSILVVDCNYDGVVNFDDINAFIGLIPS